MQAPIMELIRKTEKLPSLPTVAAEILRLTHSAEINFETLSSVIEKEPALTIIILKAANSPFFGLARKVSNVKQAMMLLGWRTIRVLALSFSLVDVLAADDKFDYPAYWRRSLITAVAARLLAQAVQLPNTEDVFVCGLLSDVGMIAAWRCARDIYAPVLERWAAETRPLAEIEKEMLGVTHAEMGRELLEMWALPESLSTAVAAHHGGGLETMPETLRPLCMIVRSASDIAGLFSREIMFGEMDRIKKECRANTGISEEKLEEVLKVLGDNVSEMADILAIRLGPTINYAELRAEATTQLAQLSMQAEVERAASATREVQARQEVNTQEQRVKVLESRLTSQEDTIKREVRSEYGSHIRLVYAVLAAVLVLAVLLAFWVKRSSDQKFQEMQTQWVGQLDQAKRDAENRYSEIKKNTEASTQTKLEQLQTLLNEKTVFFTNLAADAKKAGVDSKTMNQELLRNRAALEEIKSQIGDLNAFVSFKERNSKCVYSLVLNFTEGGVVKYSFIGSAFGLSSKPGVLGTTARVVEAVRPLLDENKCRLIARCNGDALCSYVVAQTHVHPEFKQAEQNVGKDLALLEVNLHCLRLDGTLGEECPLPALLQPASDDELDQIVSGVNVAVFGFSDLDRAKLEGEAPQTGVATLSTNIVDGTYSFSGVPVTGCAYDLLKHNCAVMKGFAGAPVVNTKQHVVGVQSNTIMLAAARGGLLIPAPNSACAVSIKALQELLCAKYPQCEKRAEIIPSPLGGASP